MKKFYLTLLVLQCVAISTTAQLTVFSDDYAPGVSFAAFGGSTNTLSIDNTQSNSGTSSLKIPVTTGYTGGALVIATPTDLSGYTAITFWAKNDNPAFKLDGVGLGNNATTTKYAVERNGVVLTSTWTKYYIPIPVPSKLTAETGLFHFAEGAGEGAYNIWIDDIQYENVSSAILGTPTAAFATETITKSIGETFNPNGTVSNFPICAEGNMQTARAYFTWTSLNTSVATINADGLGTAVAAGSTDITGQLGTVSAAGTLTVNVNSAPTAPSTAAPTPTESAADVISMFSNAYTNVTVDTWSAPWDNANVADVQVAGNDNKLYTNLVFAGIEFTSNTINATDMDFLHVDIWTPNATNFNIKLVDFGANNIYQGGDDSESELSFTPALGTWVSYDIPLTDFTALAARANLAQMLFISSNSTVYVDNVYFYKSASTAPSTAAPAPTESAADVISMFSNAYTNVTVDTWSAPWDNADVADVQVAGNDNKLYTNLVFAGIEFTSNTINATDMDFLHVDIWTPNATNFNIKLVDFGANNIYQGGDDSESELSFTPALGTWVSYDIPLTDFTALAARANLAQMLFISSNSTVYVDNVYFYKLGVVPVRFSNFKVSSLHKAVQLEWTTEFEQNNKGFAVERSIDGTNWAQVTFVDPSTENSTVKRYTAKDLAPVKGINYYRIKQVDLDGRVMYSIVQKINFNKSIAFALYPNPAKDKVSITLGAVEYNNTRYSIMNSEGKIVRTGIINKNPGNTVINLDVSGLSRGAYYFSLEDGTTRQTAKLLLF